MTWHFSWLADARSLNNDVVKLLGIGQITQLKCQVIEEDDIENLLIQQIEFCSTLVLNKTDLVTPEQLHELRALVRGLQKDAVIVEAVNGDIPMSELINTNRFDFDKAYASAAWMNAMEHPEEHEDPEVLEYEITTFVYRRRQPFDLDKLNQFVASWPKNIIRVKGSIWVSQDPEMSYVFEQAGKQVPRQDGMACSVPSEALVLPLAGDEHGRDADGNRDEGCDGNVARGDENEARQDGGRAHRP